MTYRYLYETCAVLALAMVTSPANAEEIEAPMGTAAKATTESSAQTSQQRRAFTTGVAKGRDMLDTAISASTLDEGDIRKVSATSTFEILGNLPGLRAESSGSNGYSSLTIRGLPLSADGSKFLQLQEDGLPVLEFGDIFFGGIDMFIRPDRTLAQIQSIRGGSSSTFASNSPGGVINFLSKTGDQEGGLVELTSGIDYENYRIDFDYGGHLSDSWHFNIGGFYREGEGPRKVGYTAFHGGQIKANVTKELGGGDYIRIYGKYLNDHQPLYFQFPVHIGGTNNAPEYGNVPGLDARHEGFVSRYVTDNPRLDQQNQFEAGDSREGIHAVTKSVGLEAKFDIDEWTLTERFRYAANSGSFNGQRALSIGSSSLPGQLAAGNPNATLVYATGPNAGQVITNPATVNGNGLFAQSLLIHAQLNDLDNVINDVRLSRVWNFGGGKLTTTGGLYYSSQNIDMYWTPLTALQDLAGDGNSARVDVISNGVRVTQLGMFNYRAPTNPTFHRRYDVGYRTLAPYGSLNFNLGKLALGASLRYDFGKVTGRLFSADLGGSRPGPIAVDVNGDGVISLPEQRVDVLPLSQPGEVDYTYGYLSYSLSANYRIAEPFSVFGRYSRGARAGADRVLFPPSYNVATGKLVDPSATYSPVKQAEIGAKFRTDSLAAYITGFWASTSDSNFQVSVNSSGAVAVIPFNRTYSAKGVELEAELHSGPFSLMANGTYTTASIDKDAANTALNGNRPRRQASLFFTVRPQVDVDRFALGAVVNGTTDSYTQDSNLLKQPGYVIVSPYLQYRPTDRLEFTLNAFNLFDKLAFVQVNAASVPTSGYAGAQVLNGRTVTASASLRF